MIVKEASLKKRKTIDDLVSLASKYRAVLAADLYKVRSSQVQELRNKFRGLAVFKVFKNTLVKKATEFLEVKRPQIGKFADTISGQVMLVFTDMNPFKLIILLEKNKVRVEARPGDIATNDIVVPAGNTGLPPGPIISEFTQLKIPTKVEGGSIWVVKDTVVARKGEEITPRVASVLSKLRIKPIELGLRVTSVYDGIVITGEDLKLDLNKLQDQLREAHHMAFSLAVEAGELLPQTAAAIIGKAWTNALSLSVMAGYLTKETAQLIVQKAYIEAKCLEGALAGKLPSDFFK